MDANPFDVTGAADEIEAAEQDRQDETTQAADLTHSALASERDEQAPPEADTDTEPDTEPAP